MIVLEAGKSYRLNNGWKLTNIEHKGVDEYYGDIHRVDNGIESFHRSEAAYHRDGRYKGFASDTSFKFHVSHDWSELGTSGLRDRDGWDTNDFRRAIANSGLFNF